MLIRILGSGTIKTSYLKNCSGYLLNDEFLLDCGPGIWRALSKNKIKNSQIKYIALSHFHTDHVTDLAPFLLERYLLSEKDDIDLKLIGPNGLKEWFKVFSKLFGDWMQTLPIEIIEMQSKYKFDKYNIQVLPNGHTANSICYRIEDYKGKIFFYSGDTGENENIKNLSKNADIAIIEASNTPHTKILDHLTPQIAAEIAKNSNVKKLILTHFYPEVYDSDSLSEAKKIFKNDIVLADDNMILEI